MPTHRGEGSGTTNFYIPLLRCLSYGIRAYTNACSVLSQNFYSARSQLTYVSEDLVAVHVQLQRKTRPTQMQRRKMACFPVSRQYRMAESSTSGAFFPVLCICATGHCRQVGPCRLIVVSRATIALLLPAAHHSLRPSVPYRRLRPVAMFILPSRGGVLHVQFRRSRSVKQHCTPLESAWAEAHPDMERPSSRLIIRLYWFWLHVFSEDALGQAASTMHQSDMRGLVRRRRTRANSDTLRRERCVLRA